MPDLLQRIVAHKREEVDARRRALPLERLVDRALDPPRDFVAALSAGGIGVVAEIKRRSPSAGRLCPPDADAAELAVRLASGGAVAISVVTDGPFFGGSLDDLAAARVAEELPILRKEFVIDPYQLRESRAFGADAVLLIARILAPTELAELAAGAARLGLACVVEVHAERELEAAVGSGAPVIGINCRDLETLAVDLAGSLRMRPLLPPDRIALAESGVRTREDLARVRDAGFDAALVGETLMRAPDATACLRDLLGRAPEQR